jgi:hypothetical protein
LHEIELRRRIKNRFRNYPIDEFERLNAGRVDSMSMAKLLALVAAFAASAFLAGFLSRGAVCREGGELLPRQFGGKYGYVDEGGRIVIAPRFDGADTFSEGLAVVLDSGRFGYVDARGTMAIPAVYRHARPFHGGLAVARLGDAWLLLNRAGRAFPCSGSAASPPLAATDQ